VTERARRIPDGRENGERLGQPGCLKDEQQINIRPKNDTANQTASGKASTDGGKININTATAEDLDKYLAGIGEVYSKNIVEYREKNGSFTSIEEIKNVDGIGSKRFEQIKDMITVN
jgi:competence protein ComEA